MFSNPFLLVFALAFMGCVFATPVVTRFAARLGAIDRPDQFRRVHKGAIPRLGGLGLAVGLATALLPVVLGGVLREWPGLTEWWARQGPVVIAAAIILVVGFIDDTRGMNPRPKLLGQSLAVIVLIAGGIQITKISILGFPLQLSYTIPVNLWGHSFVADPLSWGITLLWFLGCMNVWNLIDGMDGLASGVGLIVSATLMFVALRQGNEGSAALAAALAGALAGFLLYNWHPALIFLGDSGSLMIGLLMGIIGVQDSMKGTTTVSILFPILAMGLPISDTAMAIFRRWVRNLPLSAADRRHIHHLLMNMGLNPRQAAILLYFFTGGLCGIVLLGVALNNPVHGETLALLLGGSGCLAFLLILTSRRDELATLKSDWNARKRRKREEKAAAKATYEAVQRVELCKDPETVWNVLVETAGAFGCDSMEVCCKREHDIVLQRTFGISPREASEGAASGATATFRLSSGENIRLTLLLHLADDSETAADIAFRSLQRLGLSVARRLDELTTRGPEDSEPEPLERPEPEVLARTPGQSGISGAPALS